MTSIMHSMYEAEGKFVIEDENLFNSLISGLIPLGAIPGTFLVTITSQKGRRLSYLIIGVIVLLGTALSMIFNMWALIFGRLIIGLGMGMYATIGPLFISEITPPNLSGPLGSFNQMGLVTGILGAYATAFMLPLPEDSDATTNQIWRLIFVVPGVISLLQSILFLLVFRYDTPNFYKTQGNLENYNKVCQRIYSGFDTKEVFQVELKSNKVA